MSADGCKVLSTAIPLTVVVGMNCDGGNGGDKGSCRASSSSELHIIYTVRRRFCRGRKEERSYKSETFKSSRGQISRESTWFYLHAIVCQFQDTAGFDLEH